ncbi:ribosomal protein S18 acetylase RimI-like enzyme [Chryseobacterium sp. 52]|uniref:GNAT family N-acetyltransferase n=1 Tax=Chryseobacterium sp. 52 TaxID=2035213 RepID=UPI000C1A03D4|nr:GNAT family N-acetyltransferase [Chryseobacterium sp. 52]PIF47550.1 ribosomal protein S18 acetylase RimI-like enzyme [Chryseobacterium sp. 52]
MEIRILRNINVEELLSVFNTSFSDYIVPFHLSLEQLESKIVADKIDMNLSVGTFESEKLVGFILNAKKEKDGKYTVYNAGTGVIPEYRGQGLVRKMYDYVLPVLNEIHTEALTLEVIEGNVPAIRAYEHLGFKITRKLLCFNGIIDLEEKNSEIRLEEIDHFQWEIFQSFWDIQPSWQSSIMVLEQIRRQCCILGGYKDEQLVGYAVYNPAVRKIYQIAVDKNYRKQGIGTKLFSRIGNIVKGQAVSFNNVDDVSENTSAFLSNTIGLKNWVSQFEMKKDL